MNTTITQAAQTLASELVLEKLLAKFIPLVTDYAGAQRGCLILDRAGRLFIEAAASIDPSAVTVLQAIPIQASEQLSHPVVEYVYRTSEYLVLPDATQDSAFAHDTYIQHHQPRSILCLPVLSCGRFVGILYLENNLLASAFTPERIQSTQALLAHAAIALENACLYEGMQREIAERQRAETMLRSLTEGTAATVGDDYLRALVYHLAAIFQVRRAMVGECTDSTMTRVRTLALLQDGQFIDNIEYDLEGTPCHVVIGGEVGYYPENLQTLFPRSSMESYLGMPLTDSLGQLLGHMAIVDHKPMNRTPYDISLFKLFGARAGAELERQRAEEALHRREAELRHLNERLADYNRTLEQDVAERTREIERRQQVAERLRDMLAILNSNRSLDEILVYIVTEATHLLGTQSGAIYRLQPDTAMLVVQASRGLPPEYITHLAFPLAHSFLGRAIRSRRPLVISNLPAAISRSDLPLDERRRALLVSFHTLLAVPLLRLGDADETMEVYGGLALYYPEARQFSADEIDLVVAFADQATLAIENAQLRQRIQQAAVIEERGRLARDLHDSVTQSLYSLTLLAEGWRRLAAVGRLDSITEPLAELGSIAQQALKEMRLLVHQLRPPVLEKEGLLGALHQRLASVERRAGIEARLLTDDIPDLPPAVEEELYRIAQEALNNSLKHAHATTVTLHLHTQGTQLALDIIDDGCGFDPALMSDNGGVGLKSMHERAEKLGGTLTITSAPGSGTHINVSLPATKS